MTAPVGTSSDLTDRIEILSIALLDQYRSQVEVLKTMAKDLEIGIGWHYLLDWAWILSLLGDIQGKRIMDAGAGTGLLQWYLALQGAEVFSVDRSSRAELSLRFRARFAVRGLEQDDLASPIQVLKNNVKHANGLFAKTTTLLRGAGGILLTTIPKQSQGKVIIHNGDLANLPQFPDNSIDAVVAVSALEHNSPELLPGVIAELMRVLKPGGALLATLGAAHDHDWLHEPSQGWCYTDDTLRNLFRLSNDSPSNYVYYDELFSALKSCDELRLNLADFYFHSAENGMPWGRWDPQYQPVGVCKRK